MISRLKSLELQGYKTFANRTLFEFPGAVTAIVGPNGSGKSNITDALRWVLGEQSYTLLRGKKTEDMIFSGSDRRTRSGMATATVILDNSDNWLPIDFTEVAIARRAYRDGSNEYLLNGQRVRLRDVSELLSESGLAERTYTIIGQGLVDAALALRAEDRRRLFEEAAGIGLHRSRRKEAVRRLADTQRNLERVEDILLELRPRLRSLRRQARRVEEYDRTVADLRALLREWYGYHWHLAQEELAQAQDLVNDQSTALEDIRQRESEMEVEINLLRGKRQDVRDELNSFHRQSAELHQRRENTSRELAVAEERARYLQEREDRLKADISQSDEERGLLSERNKFALQEVDRLKSELEEAQEQGEAVRSAHEIQEQRRLDIETKLGEDRDLLVKLSTQRLQLISRNAERQAQLANLKKTSISTQKSIGERKERWQLINEQLETKAKELEVVEHALQEIEASSEAIKEKTIELKYVQQEADKRLATLETEISKHAAQYNVIKDAEGSYAGYSSGAKILLGAIKDSQLKETKGILGSNLNVPEKFEIAIGAVFGEYINAFILDSQSDIENALAILEHKSGKAALLPLDTLLVNGSSLDYITEDGVFGIASELISAPKALKPVVDLLTRNALIVQDRKLARKIVNYLRSNAEKMESIIEARVVTLAGEVFYVHGPVKTSSKSRPVSLSRQREGREIQDKLIQEKEALEVTKEKLSQVEANLSEIRKEEMHIEQTYAAQLQVRNSNLDAHRQMLLEDEQLKRELEWHEEQKSRNLAVIEEVRNKIQLTIGTVQELEQRESEIEGQINHHLKQLQQFPTDDLKAELTHWRTRIAVLEQVLSESKDRQVEREKFLIDAATKSEAAKASMKELIEEHHQTREAIKSLKLTNEEIAAQIDSSRNLITPLEQALEANEQELNQLLSLESKERLVSNQAEQNYTQARIAQVRKQEALDALRRQIEVDFGLVAFEYREEISGPTPLPLEGFVEDLPVLTELSEETEEALTRQRSLLRRVGPVNPEAQVEYQEVEERYQFLTTQVNDLQEAAADVQRVIEELDEIMEREFCNTFDAVAEEFHQIFGRLFGGGSARLVLTDPDDLTDTGIDIEARLPGRREQGLSLLSGGERSLTAVALVFALLRVSPTPFCVLDEVDAMLDEANVGRFRELLRELSQSTQFIMITHNRATVQVADIIYGVTMGRDSTSQVLSLKVDELEKVV